MTIRRAVIGFTIAFLALLTPAGAQTGPQPNAGKVSPKGNPALEQSVRFDDDDSSGTPCAVPGICGRCDCPKPAVSTNSQESRDRDPPSGK
jgi:hypothetical protein